MTVVEKNDLSLSRTKRADVEKRYKKLKQTFWEWGKFCNTFSPDSHPRDQNSRKTAFRNYATELRELMVEL